MPTSDLVPPPDDSAAVALVRENDEPAFGDLYDRHAPAVLRLCAGRFANRQDAEDALFVTFLEAWRRRRGMQVVGGTVRPWMLGVAGDVVRDRRQVMRRHRLALGNYTAG